jgi:hypothetical protein
MENPWEEVKKLPLDKDKADLTRPIVEPASIPLTEEESNG